MNDYDYLLYLLIAVSLTGIIISIFQDYTVRAF
jgi:hypothetical protein